jgi:uncharacterized protein (UPF0332 family)
MKALLGIAERSIADASVQAVSADARFAMAYNAILQLATIPLCCHGYRARGEGRHFTTYQTLTDTMGPDQSDRVAYFDDCRKKRNVAEYDRAGEVSHREVEELLAEAKAFMGEVKQWLWDKYPNLMAGE